MTRDKLHMISCAIVFGSCELKHIFFWCPSLPILTATAFKEWTTCHWISSNSLSVTCVSES